MHRVRRYLKKIRNSWRELLFEPPMEGRSFVVNPYAINKKRFQKKRKDENQEQIRLLIVEAFSELKNNPEKYGKPFKVLLLKNDRTMTLRELKKMVNNFGINQDWVQWAFEIAQRICNGESWKSVCNEVSLVKPFRLIKWKKGWKQVGGGLYSYSSTHVSQKEYSDDSEVMYNTILSAVVN